MSQVEELIENASFKEMKLILLSVLKWFHKNGLGNPFNYNRGFEFIQALELGFRLEPVGGGSDGVKETDEDITAEFKATADKGLTKKGKEKSHSFSYNGTSKKQTIEEQEIYCRKKIMRDPYHYWTIVNYESGKLVKTIKISCDRVWLVLWPKWKKSFHNSSTNADGRIGGSVSTNELKEYGINDYEIIVHESN